MTVSVAWEIKGTEFANCNCAYGCGCQFNALPDKGFCEAVAGYQIHQVTLDMSVSMVCAPLPCGGGPARSMRVTRVMQIVIDERADARQRDTLAQNPVRAGNR